MQLSEMDYYLIQELVEMDDRILASMIELTSFPTSHSPKHWDKFVKALEDSEDSEDFYQAARNLIKTIGAEFAVSESFWKQTYGRFRLALLENGVVVSGKVNGGNCVILLNGREI